jgi:3',5'-cyclic AMP phosphodiesterase CpdA
MLIAQLSDPHIKPEGRLAYGAVDTGACLEAAVAAVKALDPQPDIVVITGDLVDAGRPEEYARFRRYLAPIEQPVYVIPGNHDERGAFARAFAGHDYLPGAAAPFQHYAVDLGPIRMIGLDTVIPGKGGGAMCAARLDWLDATLAERPAQPTLILMHHPPFRTGIAHMDAIGLDNAAGLAAVLRRHPQAERIICGHLHRPIQCRWAGALASTAPSVAHQVALDLRPDGPSAFVMEPPGFQLHIWTPDEGFVSHTAIAGDWGPARPFFDAEGRLID